MQSIKKLAPVIAPLAFCLLLLSGCRNTERLNWSPDGSKGAVDASDGLRITDADGNLSAPVLDRVELSGWLPDSHGLCVVTTSDVKKWSDLLKLLPADETKSAGAAAELIWRSKNPSQTLRKEGAKTGLLVLAYLREKYGGTLLAQRMHAKLKDIPQAVPVHSLKVVDINGTVKDSPSFYTTAYGADHLRVSPNGNAAVLCVSKDVGYVIQLVRLKGTGPNGGKNIETLKEEVFGVPEWSRDGKSLFYFTCPLLSEKGKGEYCSDKQPVIAWLKKVDVTGQNGYLLPNVSKIEPTILAHVISAGSSHIQSLADGSIVFSGRKQTYPLLVSDATEAYIFKMNSALTKIEELVPSSKIPEGVFDKFQANSDGTRFAFYDDRGKVVSYDVAAGSGKVLAQKAEDSELKVEPNWRNSDELSYSLIRNGASQRIYDVVLADMRKPGATTTLSKDWPAKAIEFLLPGK